MKRSKTTILSFAALAAATILATEAAAKSFAQGLACTTQTAGTPLVGEVYVTLSQIYGDTSTGFPCNTQPADVQALVRLEHSQTLRTYSTTVHLTGDACNPCTVMDALLHDPNLISQIQGDFCGGSNCTIGVKDLSSVGTDEQDTPGPTNGSITREYRTLADVIVVAH